MQKTKLESKYAKLTKNVYLREVQQYVSTDPYSADRMKLFNKDPESFMKVEIQAFQDRPQKVSKYAWAIPNEEALATIAAYGPIVEVGAGSGYWAALLKARGVEVHAFDLHPPDQTVNTYHADGATWTAVGQAGPAIAEEYTQCALMLCWPPYESSMAYDALMAYKGSTVIYIGEWGGCTADDQFHNTLEEKFEQVKHVNIPSWPGIRDTLTVWKRKSVEP